MDMRIEFIEKNNTGLADSLNLGIEQTNNKWIARLDADDIAVPNRLERQLRFVESRDLVLAGSGCLIIDGLGGVIGQRNYPSNHTSLLTRLTKLKPVFPHSSAMFSTEAAKSVSLYRNRFVRSQDADLWFRLADKGTIGSVSEPLVRLRKHAESISLTNGGKIQLVMGIAGGISYFARKNGYKDPVDLCEGDWSKFVHWIEEKCISDGIYSYSDWREAAFAQRQDRSLKETFSVLQNSYSLYSNLSYVFRYLAERIFGTRIATKYFSSWIEEMGIDEDVFVDSEDTGV